MFLAETRDALVIGDQRTGKLDRCGDQQPIGRVAMIEMVHLIAAAGGAIAQWHCLHAWTIEEALDPGLNGKVEIDPPGVYEQRNLPGRNGAEKNAAAVLPGAVDQGARRCTQTSAGTRTEPRCAPKREPARALCSSSRRTAKATASVLLPPVSFLAASSISATTSGRLMVTTFAMADSCYQYLRTYIMFISKTQACALRRRARSPRRLECSPRLAFALLLDHPRLFGTIVRVEGEEAGVFACPGWPSVGPGWRQILERLCQRVEAAIASEPAATFEFVQIKEKFGRLRAYQQSSGLSSAAELAVDTARELAEARSAFVCEVCGRRGHLWDDYGWYCTACDDHGDGRPHSPKPSRRRDRDQPPLRRKPYVCHRASLRFRSRYCDVERGHWRDVVENRRDLEAVPPLTWKGSQVRSLYRPPAFARAAREGCHAEAQRAKAGRPSASYGRQASKADPSAARPSP